MVNLLIARHGNTFDKGDTILRVGRGTDLPLSNSGREQAVLLGHFLKQEHPNITAVFTSTLKRTIETAEIALKQIPLNIDIIPTDIFDEIDYGPDEGKPETDVIARLGQTVLDNWDQHNIVPEGWNVNPESIQKNWQKFSNEIQKQCPNQTVLVVTSNGNARFAPSHQVKLSTGAISHLSLDQDQWTPQYTNRKPKSFLTQIA